MENISVKPVRGRAKVSRFAKPAEAISGNVSVESIIQEIPSVRQSIRPELREESPLERAKRRAAEIKGHIGGDLDEGTDEFYIPKSVIPEGWSYEWKRKLLVGQEDPAYQVALARQGWEPVPASRHRNMMPEGHYNTIERKGMILMERPLEITNAHLQLERRKAAAQVRQKEQQLAGAPDGQFGRDDPRVKPKITKSFEPIQLEE